jgi:hypothetical protein
VVYDDGYAERFELILEPHRGGRKIGSSTPVSFSTASTWLALNADRFYVQEDAEGNEIWPVTFPAVSIDNPGRKINITLDRDGTLTWPANVQSKSNAAHSGTDNQLIYLDNLAIQDPCPQDSEEQQFETCSDGGSDNGNSKSSARFSASGIGTVTFLAIKTIRLDGTGDGSGAAELQMHVDPSYTTYNDKFRKEWQYTFDHKRGMNNRPLWFDDFSFFSLFGQGFRLFTDLSGTLLSLA